MLNEKIYEIRKELKFTQEEVADKLNVSRQTISNWETGSAQPTIDKAVELAKLYNVSLDQMVGLKIEETANPLLGSLVGEECSLYLNLPEDDYYTGVIYRREYKRCKVIEVGYNFIRIEFMEKKNVVEKLIFTKEIAMIMKGVK